MPRRTSALLLLLTLAVWASFAADRAVTVVVVEVPVHVVDKAGQPVRGLTVDQFELLDNGKRQKIAGMQVIDIDQPAPPSGERFAIASSGRHIMLLFDLSFSDVNSINLARTAALEVVRGAVHEKDLLGVATFSVNRGMDLLVGFTPDHAQALAAVGALGRSEKEQAFTDPLGLTFFEPDLMAPELPTKFEPIEPQDFAAEHLAEMSRLAEQGDRQSRLQFVESMTRGFEDFARVLAGVPGRKDVIFLSRGFENDLVFAARDQQQIAQMNSASEAGRIWEVDGNQRFGNAEKVGDIESMLGSLRQADCVVHTIDLLGARVDSPTRTGQAGGDSGGNEGLSAMASGTGGIYVYNTNAFAGEMTKVLATTRVTYLLTFQPSKLKADGKSHKLKVKLAGVPSGYSVYHRSSYKAPVPFARLTGREKQLDLAGRLLSTESGGQIPATALATPLPLEAGKTFVPFLVEIDGPGLLAGVSGNIAAAQLFVYAVDTRGRVGDFLVQTIGVKLEQARQVLERTGLKFYGTLELPPGEYVLRVLVVDPRDGRSGLTLSGLEVPGLTEGPQLAPPLFPDEAGSWVLSREGQGEETTDEPFPFVVDDKPFLPAGRPHLTRGIARTFYLLGRNLKNEPLRARFLDASGGVVAESPLAVRPATSALSGLDARVTELTPALPAGSYELQIVGEGDRPVARVTVDVDG